tara:strand:- start:2708 stop:2965 length:258 start_codon:yes stop_codon:yes gene_type:complete
MLRAGNENNKPMRDYDTMRANANKKPDLRKIHNNTKSNKLPIVKVDNPVNKGYDDRDMVKCSNDKKRFNKANSIHESNKYFSLNM